MRQGAAGAVDSVQGGVSHPERWVWPVAVLALCHAAAIAAFQILNILVEPIKAALRVSDTQYSLMQGLAVAIFASTLGIPAARVADRGNRRLVVLVGVVTWSIATLTCAAAQSATQLFVARMLVGVGEAFLYPAALSMIADFAPSNRLSTAIGAFGCGGPVGAALAMMTGGWLLQNGDQLSRNSPWGSHDAWRIAFLICAVLGALAAGLLLTFSEPRRRGMAGSLDGHLRMALLYVRHHWQVFLGVSGTLLALSYCVFATSSWTPTMLVRVRGMSYAGVAAITGPAVLVGGVLAASAAGLVTDKIEAKGARDAALRVAIVIAALFLLTIAIAVLMPFPGWAATSICITYSLLGVPTVIGGTALQQISPPAIRAQVMAIQVLLVNLIALSLGPLTVAALTDHLFGRAAAVGYSLALTNAFGALSAVGAALACRRRFSHERRMSPI